MASLNDLISSAECIEIIRNSQFPNGNFRMVSYKLDKLNGEPGYIGEYAHLVVTLEMENRKTVTVKYFLKCLPFTDPKQKEFVEEHGLFTKEAVCYRELFSKFEQSSEKVIKWRPSCWLARDDLMAMEDLIDSGYRSMPFQRPFGNSHVKLVLERTAQMHACSLDLEFNRLNGAKLEDNFGSMLFETVFTRKNSWFSTGLKGLLTAALEGSKYAENPAYKAIMKAQLLHRMEHVYELSKPLGHFQSVMVHRDLWYNNIMFQFDQEPDGADNCDRPVDCVLIDFQLARYQPPVVDFLCTIYLLTRRQQRDELFDFYLKYYYGCLKERLKKFDLRVENILPWNQFTDSLEHYRLLGLLWSGILHTYVNLPEGYLSKLHAEDQEAYHEFGTISRDAILVKFLAIDPYYRETLMDAVDETLEYLFGFE